MLRCLDDLEYYVPMQDMGVLDGGGLQDGSFGRLGRRSLENHVASSSMEWATKLFLHQGMMA